MGPGTEETATALNELSLVPKLTSSNWLTVKARLSFALKERQLFGYVDGTIVLSDSASQKQKEQFNRQDARALSRLSQAVSDTYLYLILNAETAREAWQSLENHFEKRSQGEVRRLKRDFLTARMNDTDRSITEVQRLEQHIAFMRSMVTRLVGKGEIITETEYVDSLLSSLPDRYRVLVSTISALPDAELLEDKVTQRLRDEAIRLDERKGKSGNYFSSGNDVTEQVVLHSRGGLRCHLCNEIGHFKRECPRRQNHSGTRSAPTPAPAAQGTSRGMRGGFRGRGRGYRGGYGYRRRQGNSAVNLMASDEHQDENESTKSNDWIIDSGATKHMSYQREQMVNFKEFSEVHVVRMGDGRVVEAKGKGTVQVKMTGLPGGPLTVNIHEVWHVPSLRVNLLSVQALTDSKCQVVFYRSTAAIYDQEGYLVGTGKRKAGKRLTVLNCKFVTSVETHQEAANADGQDAVTKPSDSEDEGEQPSKETDATAAVNKLQDLHERLGHISHRSIRSMKHHNMVHGIDFPDTDRGVFCEGCAEGKQTKQPRNRHPGTRAKQLLELVHTDVYEPTKTESPSGKRYIVTFIDDFSRYTFVYMIRHKSEVTDKLKLFEAFATTQTGHDLKAIRSDNGGEYVNADFEEFCQLKGIKHQRTVPRTPNQNGVAERANRTLGDMARTMLLAAKLPENLWAEAFNAAVYIKNRVHTTALEKVTPYEVWFGKKPSIRHIRKFGEKVHVHIPEEQRSSKLSRRSKQCLVLGFEDNGGYRLLDVDTKKLIVSRDVIFGEKASPSVSHQKQQAGVQAVQGLEEEKEDSDEDDQDQPRRSERLKKKTLEVNSDAKVAISLTASADAVGVEEALSGPNAADWQAAMNDEYHALIRHNTWELTTLPEGRTAIDSKWVLRIKENADGSGPKFKARLVCKGFSQVPGVDYEETYAPVMYQTSLRCIVAFGTMRGMQIDHMDVKTAFLNGNLDEEIYMHQPAGFVNKGEENFVCKLLRSIYGLKQSPKCWNDVLNSFLVSDLGFQRSEADQCIYRREVKGNLILMGIYVDDLLIAADTAEDMRMIKERLSGRFDMTDLGQVKQILGIEVDRRGNSTFLGQSKYAWSILEKFGMSDCNATSTPREVNEHLAKHGNEDEPVDKSAYQSLVGSLMYLMLGTRPDLANAVGAVAQHCVNPGHQHWAAAKRILRYVKGTVNQGILFGGSDASNDLVGYADADWAGDRNDRKSVSGFVFLFGGGPVSWASKKQTTVALSTAEAEYVASAAAVQEIKWLRQVLDSIQSKQATPTVLFVDNKAAIALTRNPGFHPRTKHMDIKLHFIREAQADGVVDVQHCSSVDNAADIFTKAVPRDILHRHKEAIGIGEPVTEDAYHAATSHKSYGLETAVRLLRRAGGNFAYGLMMILALLSTRGCFAATAKQYQFCGGKKIGMKIMSVEELGEYQTYVYISPTIAARLRFNRTDIAADVTLVGIYNKLKVWNCSKVSAIDKYPGIYPDIPDDNRYHPVPTYKAVVLVDSNETLFANVFGELVWQSPYSWSYVTRNKSQNVQPDSVDEKRFFKFASDPMFDGQLIQYQSAVSFESGNGIRSLAMFASDRSVGEHFPTGEFLSAIKSETTEIGSITKLLLKGNIQLAISRDSPVQALVRTIPFGVLLHVRLIPGGSSS
jgi:transposase InsO family protein